MPWFRVIEFNGLVSTKSQVVPGFFNVRIFYSGLDTVDLHYHTKRTHMYRNFGPNRRPLTAREKSIRFRYGALFVFSALCAITLGVLYTNQEIDYKQQTSEIKILKNKVDSLQNLSDSLYAENFPCQIELGRYQIAYEIFLERNRKAAEQYGTIISEETE